MFHNMTEQDWKEFFQKEAELEAERIMRMVDADPSLKDVHAPEGLFEALMKRIEEWEFAKGMAQVDGVPPSDEVLELAEQEVLGKTNIVDMKEYLRRKYSGKNDK